MNLSLQRGGYSMPRWTLSLPDRFWSKVEKTDGCWLWTASLNGGGYGQFMYNHRPVAARKIAWLLTYGKPRVGLYVLHKCDVRKCVNPMHLFLGTQRENILDMITKMRGNTQRLSINDVALVRESSDSNIQLAERFKVNRSTIDRIRNRKTWSHI